MYIKFNKERVDKTLKLVYKILVKNMFMTN